jgi:hypothetical protein
MAEGVRNGRMGRLEGRCLLMQLDASSGWEFDAWLQAATSDDANAALRAAVPISDALDRLADQLLNFTPAELLTPYSPCQHC